MVSTGNGELGFNSREVAWETATPSKEGGTAEEYDWTDFWYSRG